MDREEGAQAERVRRLHVAAETLPPTYRLLLALHDDLLALRRIDFERWADICSRHGVLTGAGQLPSAESLRMAWWRVRRDVREGRLIPPGDVAVSGRGAWRMAGLLRESLAAASKGPGRHPRNTRRGRVKAMDGGNGRTGA